EVQVRLPCRSSLDSLIFLPESCPAPVPHRLGPPLDLVSHLGGGQMHFLTVAGQDPLEAVRRQPLHRIGLLLPRIPAIILGRRKPFRISVPIQMVTREEEALAQEQNTMPLGVARRRDCEEAWRQFPRPFPIEG